MRPTEANHEETAKPRTALLQARGITVEYRTRPVTRAVSDVSFDLEAGTALSIVGESGSGKSSVVRAIGGLLRTSADVSWDSLIIDGTSVLPTDVGAVRRLSYVFQEPKSYLNPSLRIGRQLMEILKLQFGIDQREARRRSIELLADVGIPDGERMLGEYVHQLSGGLAQRVAIAMAIAPEPSILIADEPTSALDVTVAAKVIGLIRKLQGERGMALIHVTHNLHLAAKTADRILVMYAGEVVESGVARDVLEAPQMPYTKALLAAAPTADGQGGLKPIPGGPPDLRYTPGGCRFQPRCVHADDRCSAPIRLTRTGPEACARCCRVFELNSLGSAGGVDESA